MGDWSKIEWTDATWNPVTGCTKVSAGCKHCYAERIAQRFGQNFSTVTLHPERLETPLRWKRPRRIFVCSVSDLFHESVPFDFIHRVFDVMGRANQHTFQVLTKRPERMLSHRDGLCVCPNVWLGVSVENQETADERIPLLLQTPAAVRWLSIEPMIGPVDLHPFMVGDGHDAPHFRDGSIRWIVVGGESGPKARPMYPEWARSVRDQCVNAGVSFFFKQWGEWGLVLPGDEDVSRIGKKAAGRLLYGREWNEFPGFEES